MSRTKTNILKFSKPKRELVFNKTNIKKLQDENLQARTRIYDKNHQGFIIQATKSTLMFRSYGKPKGSKIPVDITIGEVGTIALDKAINIHLENYSMLKQGLNPNEVAKEKALQEMPMDSIMNMVSDYLKTMKMRGKHSPKNSITQEGILRNHIAPFVGKKSFEDISDNEWKKFVLGNKSEAIAKNCMKLLSATFNTLSRKEQKDIENPMTVVRRKKLINEDNTKKNIVLNTNPDTNNLGAYWNALMVYLEGFIPDEVIIPPSTKSREVVDAMLFCLLTGVRHEATLGLKWEDVNWKERTITLYEKGRMGKKNITSRPITDYLFVMLKGKEKKKGKIFNTTQATMDKAGKRIGLLLSYLETDPTPKFITKLIKDKQLINQKDYRLLVKRTTWDKELNVELNKLGTKPHGLRRANINIASILGISDSVQSAMLDHSSRDIDSQHYRTIDSNVLLDSFTRVGRYIDNRIAEYIGARETDDKLESPIFKYLGESVKVNKDNYYQTAKQIFPKEIEYKIGD